MKNITKRFQNAYSALVEAYHNNTLVYSDSCACAVGNICAYANGNKVVKASNYSSFFEWENKKTGKRSHNKWSGVFSGGEWVRKDSKKGLAEIKPTGYTPEELFDLENFFLQQSQINGCNSFETLYALVDYLLSLDGQEPITELHKGFETTKEEALKLIETV